jgi:hypothetical protein
MHKKNINRTVSDSIFDTCHRKPIHEFTDSVCKDTRILFFSNNENSIVPIDLNRLFVFYATVYAAYKEDPLY